MVADSRAAEPSLEHMGAEVAARRRQEEKPPQKSAETKAAPPETDRNHELLIQKLEAESRGNPVEAEAAIRVRKEEKAKIDQLKKNVDTLIDQIKALRLPAAEESRLIDAARSAFEYGLSAEAIGRIINSVQSSMSTAVIVDTLQDAFVMTAMEQEYDGYLRSNYPGLTPTEHRQVIARAAIVDLNNSRSVRRFAEAMVDDSPLPPVLREHDVAQVTHYIRNTEEGREQIRILNAAPPKLKVQVYAEQIEDKKILEELQKKYAEGTAEHKAINTMLEHQLYKCPQMHALIQDLHKGKITIADAQPHIAKAEADFVEWRKRKAERGDTPETPAQKKIEENHPQNAKPTAEKKLDLYEQMEQDKGRMEAAKNAAMDMLNNPSKKYPQAQYQDALAWLHHHADAVQYGIKQTAQTILQRQQQRSKEVQQDVAVAANRKNTSGARAEAFGNIAESGNSFLADYSKQYEKEYDAAAAKVLETGELDRMLETASRTASGVATAVEIFSRGALAIVDGNKAAAELAARHAARGESRIRQFFGASQEEARKEAAATREKLTAAGNAIIDTVVAPVQQAKKAALAGVSNMYERVFGPDFDEDIAKALKSTTLPANSGVKLSGDKEKDVATIKEAMGKFGIKMADFDKNKNGLSTDEFKLAMDELAKRQQAALTPGQTPNVAAKTGQTPARV